MNGISPPPKNVLGFSVKTSSWDRDKPPAQSSFGSYDNSRRFIASQTPIVEPTREELEWYARQNQPFPTDDFDTNAQTWLDEMLGEDVLCKHCGNTLVMQYNVMRDGWMVHCTYCGACGPCERDQAAAVEGFIRFVNIETG